MSKVVTCIVVLGISFVSFSQQVDSLNYRQEVGLNQANFIVLVDKDENTYDFNYKYHFPKTAIRTAVNFDFLNSNNQGKLDFDLFIGYEFKKNYDRWQFFYGVDVSYAHINYIEDDRKVHTYGLNPMMGLKYFIKKRFAITVNPKLNFFYSTFRNPDSLISSENFDEWKIQIGGIGNFILSYHL